MSLKVASKAEQTLTLPAVLVASHANNGPGGSAAVKIVYEDAKNVKVGEKQDATGLQLGNETSVVSFASVLEALVGHVTPDAEKASAESRWIEKATRLTATDFKSIESPLFELDTHLTLRTFVTGYTLSNADLILWGTIRGNRAAYAYVKKDHLISLGRWFRFIEEINPWTAKAIEELSAHSKEKKTAQSKSGASYDIALPDTEKGVVTRFPPEPSGYLHIGHAKAALLNDYFAHEKYKGTLLVRFDDTNPSKEKEEFQDAIIEDLALMGITPDKKSFTSDYFKELHKYCVRMIKEGKAYADDTDQATMKTQRWDGLASVRRDRPVEESLAVFEEMAKGTELGQKNCIRAKISVDNPNKAMRDPVIYRCNLIPHHRTGTDWKAYPTYDFCCPIVDSMEGVTHALRTNEYRDRNPQYEWMLDALDLRKVHIWDFARMNFVRTLLSKRKLTKFVDQGVVWGWDDPRFPTVRGIRRRGMTIEALREFILKQGPSRNIVNLDWTLFWATNRRYIDPVAPRYTALLKEGLVEAWVQGADGVPYKEERPRHGKNAALGNKKVAFGKRIYFEQEDAKSFKEGEEITLMNWGNAIVRKITTSLMSLGTTVTKLELELHLQGDVKKTEKKVTWLSLLGQDLASVELVDFDYLITKDKLEEEDDVADFLTPHTEFRTEAIADENVRSLKVDDIIQFERKGYYRVDRAWTADKPAVLFNIPTGKGK